MGVRARVALETEAGEGRWETGRGGGAPKAPIKLSNYHARGHSVHCKIHMILYTKCW